MAQEAGAAMQGGSSEGVLGSRLIRDDTTTGSAQEGENRHVDDARVCLPPTHIHIDLNQQCTSFNLVLPTHVTASSHTHTSLKLPNTRRIADGECMSVATQL